MGRRAGGDPESGKLLLGFGLLAFRLWRRLFVDTAFFVAVRGWGVQGTAQGILWAGAVERNASGIRALLVRHGIFPLR